MKKITVLPFGTILTQLPLIIIGALYMLYLGLCALNRPKDVTLTENSVKQEKYVDSSAYENTVDYFSLSDLSKEKSSFHAETVRNNYDSLSWFLISFINPDQGVFSTNPDFCLFSRPPPFIG